ncbi:conserved hypothetical protein [Ricinus communis]|uniref:Uncharacterized protein n=1 Tax=Ricinus communis TaxID=3988 RepID=B9SIZ1_RICCO|nr:conserved hypothetical protein [Ricinus communis]
MVAVLECVPALGGSLMFTVVLQNDQDPLHGLKYNDTSSCKPEESSKGLQIIKIYHLNSLVFVQMVKGVRYVDNFGEVAPALLTFHRRSSSINPKLETIAEELDHSNSYFQSLEVVVPKRVVFLLPLVLSMGMYFLINKAVGSA